MALTGTGPGAMPSNPIDPIPGTHPPPPPPKAGEKVANPTSATLPPKPWKLEDDEGGW